MELINVGNNLVILNVIRSSLFGLIFSVLPHYYNSHNKEANISLDEYKLNFYTKLISTNIMRMTGAMNVHINPVS